MRLYYMFHIQEQYEQFMVGREQQLFQLLSGYVHARRNEKEMAYICREIDVTSIQAILEQRMKKYFTVIQKSHNQFELIHELKGTIFITIEGHQLCAVCDGSRMLDLDLFIALSGEGDRYFAFMDGQHEWGWLKPFKNPNEIVERMTVFR